MSFFWRKLRYSILYEMGQIVFKTPDEIESVRHSAQIVSRALGEVARMIGPGVTTLEIDKLVDTFIRDHGGTPAFKGYKPRHNREDETFPPFPGAVCASVNEAVVHGIPDDRPLQEGDIVSIDIGVLKDGFYGDHAYTFAIGEVKPEVWQLLQVTKACLDKGIEQVQKGKRVGDISWAIGTHATQHGYGIVKELSGHGLGRNLHEEPDVANQGRRGNGPLLKEGIILAIEPMINLGTADVRILSDHWTIVTRDGKPSAHYEHDVAILNGKTEVLSTFDFVEEALRSRGLPIV